jgi:hypothetical protein
MARVISCSFCIVWFIILLGMIHGGRALHPKLDGPLTAEFVRNAINFAILFIL